MTTTLITGANKGLGFETARRRACLVPAVPGRRDDWLITPPGRKLEA